MSKGYLRYESQYEWIESLAAYRW